MGVLQIVSDSPGAGKTCLACGLLALLSEAGQRAAYCKPFSKTSSKTQGDDPDVFFVSRPAGGGLGSPGTPTVPAPHPLPTVPATGASLDDLLSRQIKGEVAQLEGESGLVIMESPDLAAFSGAPSPLIELSTLLESTVVLMFRYAKGLNAANVIAAAAPFGDRLAGVVVNGVTVYRLHEVKERLAPELEDAGVRVLGALPEDRGMLAVTVLQIANHLGGRWVQEPVNQDALIERFLIGGNIMDSGPTYFGRYANQAVITRSARPDIQLASLTADTRFLILTEGGEPAEYVKAEALERGVPLLLVPGSTLETAEALGGLVNLANPYSPWKIARFVSLLRQHSEVAALLSRLN